MNGVNFDFVPVGNFFLTITLTDDNPAGPLSTSYSVFVQVAPKPDDGDGGGPDPPGPNRPTPNPPVPTQPADEGIISDLTNTGDVVINLDEDFNLNSLLQLFETQQRRRNLKDGKSRLKEPAYPSLDEVALYRKHRMLQAVDQAIDANDLIEVELLPSPESNPADLDFEWALVEADNGEIRFKLNFENPEEVSSKIDNDQIRITIKDPKTITDPDADDIKQPTVIIQDIVR